MKYDHRKIEKKWQEVWAESGIYATQDSVDGKENFYLLVEFPYPSGNLHVGHWYAFAEPDILARYLRMKGKNVLYPIGFDAFGLPAENAAIKHALNPRTWTERNIAHMKEQIRSMGTSFDWSREVSTIDPGYYKWTQWLFIQLYKKGLVYQKEAAVNWCPTDKTVLANEQVVDGKCERCGSEVVQKQMLQWNIRITDYADRLIDDLAALDWPDQIKESQRNWIGRSEGAEIDFQMLFGGQKRTANYIFLHGKGATSKSDFWPWLKEQLERRGHTVQTFDMPNTDAPVDEEQADFVQERAKFDENSIIVGHSFGGIVALRLLERGVKVAATTLIGTPVTPAFKDGEERPTVSAAIEKGFNGEAIRANAGRLVLLYDVDDVVVDPSDGDTLQRIAGGHLFKVKANDSHFTSSIEPDVLAYCDPTITVFTTRPDTLFGATYLVLAPEHPWVTLALEHRTVLTNNDEVLAYVRAASKKTELERQTDQKEKTGVRLEGVEAVNPATGERIPMYVADYVLGHYGTGAIMAVPAHDERDYEFATRFGLPIRQVVRPLFGKENKKDDAVFRETVSAFIMNKKGEVMLMQWKEFDWLTGVIGGLEAGEDPAVAAEREVYEETGYKAKAVFVSPIATQSYFYAEHKNEWRSRLDHPVLLELLDETPDAVEAAERMKHEPVWMPLENALQARMFENNRTALELAAGIVSAYTATRHGESAVLCNSGEFDGLEVPEAKRRMTDTYGRRKVTYKLRDWIVSRQRYWGVPIPIVHCEKCGAQPVPEEQLPVELPPVEDYLPDGKGKSPLAKVKEFVETVCPTCGGAAARETDTLDTFVDSSWYFLRYVDPNNDAEFASRARQDAWMPVDLYSGGAEHTTMHLLYSRFWHKALYDLGLVADAEPYKRRMNRSLILGPDGQKMSKSRGNVVDPDEVVARLGADTVRLYLAFIGPYNEVSSYPWDPNGVVGVRRFLERLARAEEYVQDAESESLRNELHRSIKKVGEDIEAMKFNTAISQMMVFLNALDREKRIGKEQWSAVIRLIAPFAPHLAEELWSAAGHAGSVHTAEWPAYDEAYLTDGTVTIAIQIDGKKRGEVTVASAADRSAVEAAARDAVHEKLVGKEIARSIVVPGRLVNFVTA